MKISPIDYEIFTQFLHKHLLERDGFKNVDVQHNVTLKGKSGARHQIDVAWSTRIANVTQLFCVECKQWKSRVKKEHISSFLGKLADIGNARGIYVTTAGYQRGAVLLAEQYGVTLITANYEPRILPATLTIGFPQYYDRSITFEKELTNQQLEMLADSFEGNEPQIIDSLEGSVGSLSDLLNRYDHDRDGRHDQRPENCFIRSPWGLLKIVEISYDFEANIHPEATLHGEYEVAEVVARYISENQEVRATLASHR